MDFEISNLNTLNRLQDRAVRGAMPGSFNTPESGKVYVDTVAGSTGIPKEYLIQPDIEQNTITGVATFTTGSKYVGVTGSPGIQVGDTIRKDGEHGVYVVEGVSGSTTYTLDRAFTTDHSSAPGTMLTGPYTSRKVLYKNLSYEAVENTPTDPNNFFYNKDRLIWQESSDATPVGPFQSATDTFKDGIKLHFLSRNSAPSPDMQGVGSVYKHLVRVRTDHEMNSLSVPAVPYQGDESTVWAEEKQFGSAGFTDMVKDSGYFLDYTGNPTPNKSSQYPFKLRTQTRLLKTSHFFAWAPIDQSYNGQWAIQDLKDRMTSILLGDEHVTIGEANDPPFISEMHEVTQEDLNRGGFQLSFAPVSKVAVNIWESSAQMEGLDFIIADGWVSWSGYGLEHEVYLGVTLRSIYQAIGDSIPLYLYKDYYLDPIPGMITTIKQMSGAVFTVQQVVLTSNDIKNKYVLLGSAPVGPVALNVSKSTAQSVGHDFVVEGNRISWDGLGLDLPQLVPGLTMRIVYQSGTGEDPMLYMMRDVNVFKCGIRGFRGWGSFDSVDPGDPSTWGTESVLGSDFFINEANGAFLLNKKLAIGERMLFEYHNKGYSLKTDALDPSLSPAGIISDNLRLSSYPVIPLTYSVKAQGGGNGVRSLVDGVDYVIALDTGIVTLLTPHVQGETYYFSYLPAVVNYYAIMEQPQDGTMKYRMRAYIEPARGSSNTTILVYNKQALENGIFLDTLQARTLDGRILILNNLRFDQKEGKLLFDANNNVLRNDGYLLDYEFMSAAVPFAPLVRLSKTLKKGKDWFQTDGSDIGSSLKEGQVISISPYDTKNQVYYQIKNILNASGLNRQVILNNQFKQEMKEPTFRLSDNAVNFVSVDNLSVQAYTVGDSQLILDGDFRTSFGIAKMILVEDSSPKTKSEIYHIVSCRYNNDLSRTEISVSPQFLTTESRAAVLDAIKVSDSVVYQEGDTALITKYPIYPSSFPVWEIKYLPEDNGGYATVQMSKDEVKIIEYLPETKNEYSVGIEEGYNIDDTATAITQLGGGGKFGVDWLFPRGGGLVTENMERSYMAFRMPYITKSKAQVRKKAVGDTVFRPLKWGAVVGDGDYCVLDGYVYLKNPIVFGEKYVVTYVGVDNLSTYRGRALQVEGRRFVPMPGRSMYRVSYDYLRPDQYFIDAPAYKTFLETVVGPYLEAAAASKEGPKPSGIIGGSDTETSSNAEGGLTDSFYQLRDEKLKLDLYMMSYKYYVDRMGYFAREYQLLTSVRYANCEFSGGMDDGRFNLPATSDIDNYATFGVSIFSPTGHTDTEPKVSERFLGYYKSYGEANFFNQVISDVSTGIMLADKAEFTKRGLAAGDQIRINGRKKLYTIAQIVSDEEIRFTSAIEGKAHSSGFVYNGGVYKQKSFPLFSWLTPPSMREVSKKGYQYWVRTADLPAFPVVDDQGCPDAVARADIGEPYPLADGNSYANVLCVKVSTDYGVTWATSEINLSFLDEPYTASRVAQAISRGSTQYDPAAPATVQTIAGLSSLFKIYAEKRYFSEGVESSKTLDTSWPLGMPDKMEKNGVAYGIVMRANSVSTWFQFTEPAVGTDSDEKKTGASTLGFPVDVVFKGNLDGASLTVLASTDKANRAAETLELDRMLYVYNKMDRSNGTVYKTPLTTSVSVSRASEVQYRDLLTSAEAVTSSIMIETDATPAIADSFAQASTMHAKYVQQHGDSVGALSADDVFTSAVSANADRFLCTVVTETISQEDASAEAEANYASSGVPTITLLTASIADDNRIIFGDQTEAYSFAGYSANPSYVQSSVPTGQYDKFVKSSWNTAASTPRSIIYVTASPNATAATVAVTSSKVSVFYQKNLLQSDTKEFLLSEYTTMQSLVTAMNASNGGYYTASLTNGQSTAVSPADKLLYGSVPSSKLVVSAAAYLPAYLTTEGLKYTDSNSTVITMKSAITVTPKISGISTMDVSAGAIVLHNASIPGGQVTVPYSGSSTLSSIVASLQSSAGVYFTFAHDAAADGAYKVGNFLAKSGVTLPAPVYFGVKGDILFCSLSDANLNSRKSELQARTAELVTALASYPSRSVQVKTSVGPDGEDLYYNQYLWLSYIADKEAGPCVKIPYMKKRLMGSRLLKTQV